MARFNTATVNDLPVNKTQPKREGPSQRSIVQTQYREQLSAAFGVGPDSILQLELEETDQPLTERNRLVAAATALGFSVNIKRRGNTMYVLRVPKGQGLGERPVKHRVPKEAAPAPARGKGGKAKGSK